MLFFGFLMLCLCALYVWLCAVWFLLFAIVAGGACDRAEPNPPPMPVTPARAECSLLSVQLVHMSYALMKASNAAAKMSRADIANRMRRLPGAPGPHLLADWLLAVPKPRTLQRGRANARQCSYMRCWGHLSANDQLMRLGLPYGTTLHTCCWSSWTGLAAGCWVLDACGFSGGSTHAAVDCLACRSHMGGLGVQLHATDFTPGIMMMPA